MAPPERLREDLLTPDLADLRAELPELTPA